MVAKVQAKRLKMFSISVALISSARERKTIRKFLREKKKKKIFA